LNIEPPTFVRWIQNGEGLEELVNEAKYRAWSSGAEHAVLTLETGERPIVIGGRDGIRFDVEDKGDGQIIVVDVEGRRLRVVRIEWHTHPRVTGPSDGDREAIRFLRQAESRIYEMGGEPDGTSFGPDKGKPGG
jgi:hypothetical protein